MRESGTRVFSPAGMTSPLTPALALAYLYELSLDVRAAVVLDRAGASLAGDASLAARAQALLRAQNARPSGESELSTVTLQEGSLLLARTPDGGAIAVLAGPFALVSLLEHDLAAAARTLVTTASDLPGSRDSPC
jgi:sirohydrochlorin ferrochelatase